MTNQPQTNTETSPAILGTMQKALKATEGILYGDEYGTGESDIRELEQIRKELVAHISNQSTICKGQKGYIIWLPERASRWFKTRQEAEEWLFSKLSEGDKCD